MRLTPWEAVLVVGGWTLAMTALVIATCLCAIALTFIGRMTYEVVSEMIRPLL